MFLAFQTLLIGGVMGWAAMSPPSFGAMMIIPIGPAPIGPVVGRVVQQGGLLLQAGPIDGSVIIVSRRDVAERAIAGSKMLLLAAPKRACGSTLAQTTSSSA